MGELAFLTQDTAPREPLLNSPSWGPWEPRAALCTWNRLGQDFLPGQSRVGEGKPHAVACAASTFSSMSPSAPSLGATTALVPQQVPAAYRKFFRNQTHTDALDADDVYSSPTGPVCVCLLAPTSVSVISLHPCCVLSCLSSPCPCTLVSASATGLCPVQFSDVLCSSHQKAMSLTTTSLGKHSSQ